MVRAWYHDESDEEQGLPHMTDPAQILDIETVSERTGILYFRLDPDNFTDRLTKIKTERNYTYEDVCEISRETLPNYDEMLKCFFREHIHADEEIRYCAEGSGYFDVRDFDDRWIRIEANRGDLIILPAGIYHRFTLDTKNYMKAFRFFAGEPVWTAYYRPADEHPARLGYLKTVCCSAKHNGTS